MAQLSFSNIKPLYNVLINPCLDIWQRGVSQTFTSGSAVTYFVPDRWIYSHELSTGVSTVARNSGGPSWPTNPDDLPYMVNIAIDTADTSLAIDDYGILQQSVEGYIGRHLLGKKVTLSFYAYGSTTGTYCVAIRSGDGTRTYLAEYTIDSANTMERKVITFTMDDPNDTKYPPLSTTCFKVAFITTCGSGYGSGSVGWNTGNYLATSNQTNLYASSSNYLLLTGFQMTEGEDPGYLIPRTFQEEMILCQRYWEKSYIDTKYPGNPDTEGMLYARSSGTTFLATIPFKVTKRTNATPYGYSPSTGTVGYVYDYTTPGGDVAYSAITAGDNSMYVLINSVTDAHSFGMQWVADAEI